MGITGMSLRGVSRACSPSYSLIEGGKIQHILFSVQPPRKVCVANRNIGQICLNIFIFYLF